jgi:hypothetical protein
MKESILNLFERKRAVLAIFGIVSMFGMAGPANAQCVTGPNDTAAYTLLIDASSTCANLSENMFGCEVAPGGTGCQIMNNDGETIDVMLDNGTVGDIIPIDWRVQNAVGPLVDLAILVGATNGGSCGFAYPPGAGSGEGMIFQKSVDPVRYQKVNKLFFCSDFDQPAPDVPRLVVTKTVTTESDTTCSSSVESLDVSPGDKVRYCYKVKNIGIGDAESVTLNDDAGTPGDTIDDFLVTLSLPDGSPLGTNPLVSDAEVSGMSNLVTMDKVGTVVNTAKASATSALGTSHEATDTATVNVVVVAEICPDNFQEAVNQLSLETGLDYAFLADPNEGGRLSVCVPNGEPDPLGNPTANTKRYACIDQCVTKPECVLDPTATGCSPSVCEPSGSWSTFEDGICTADAPDPIPTNPLPYCWEIQQDLDGKCSTPLNVWQPQEETVIKIKKGRVNPYVWQSCYTSGGRYVCETMCYIYPGETDAACPLSSTVVN